MSRYIDADILTSMLDAKADMALGTPKEVFLSVVTMVVLLPQADVVEVRHGEWQVWENHPTIYGRDTLYVCSERTAKFTDTFNYCPNCGAKMYK